MRAVRPPRAAFLDFPLGHTTGKPHDPAGQRAILTSALDAFNTLTEPGSLKLLPFVWSDDETWRDRAQREDGDSRMPRHDTPQYQTEADRQQAEDNYAEACATCVVLA